VVLLATACTAGAAAATAGPVRYAQDRLSVAFHGVPLARAIEAIAAAAAGARLHGEVTSSGDVTVEFDAVPLRDALPRLLGGQNFTLTYGDGGALKAITLLDSPPPADTPPMDPGRRPAATGDAPARLRVLLDTQVPVPPGPLVEVVRGSATTYLSLWELAATTDEPALRAEAIRVGLAHLERDAHLAASVSATLRAIGDHTLLALLQTAAGAHARDVALQIMAHTTHPDVRQRAAVLMRHSR
jgi:hypothetical protein